MNDDNWHLLLLLILLVNLIATIGLYAALRPRPTTTITPGA